MKVAAVQYRAVKHDLQASLEGLCALARLAAPGSDLLVLPEMAVTGYVFRSPEDVSRVAEPPEGPTFQALSRIAAQTRCWIVAGFPEVEGEHFFNSAMVIDREGALRFVYRKTLLYELDFFWATPGDSGYRTFETGAGTFGVGICMDLNDDAFIEWLGSQTGLDAIAFPTNWLDQGYQVWGYWAWRLEGVKAALVAANTWGHEEGTAFRGESAVLRQRTLLAAAPPTGNGFIGVELTPRVEAPARTPPPASEGAPRASS